MRMMGGAASARTAVSARPAAASFMRSNATDAAARICGSWPVAAGQVVAPPDPEPPPDELDPPHEQALGE